MDEPSYCPHCEDTPPTDDARQVPCVEVKLEYLRGRLRAECISMGELAELQELAEYIEPGDMELLEPAGVPEELAYRRVRFDEMGEPIVKMATCGHCGRSWNDAAISAITPTPAGRCPFEYDHEYDEA